MSSEPASPPRVPLPGAAQGLSFPVLHADCASSHSQTVLFHTFLPTQKIGKQLEIGGLGVFGDGAVIQGNGKRAPEVERESGHGCEHGMLALLACTHSAALYGWCVYTAVRIF